MFILSKLVNAKEICEELNLTLKVVTSVKSFETYNCYYNIFGDKEEPCRRIVVITPFEDLEEVEDENPAEEVLEPVIVEGNLWIKDYQLLTPPSQIDLREFMVDRELVKKLIK
ncbi:MAG: hypothetical protein ACRC2K_07980 [Clostridium sp.]